MVYAILHIDFSVKMSRIGRVNFGLPGRIPTRLEVEDNQILLKNIFNKYQYIRFNWRAVLYEHQLKLSRPDNFYFSFFARISR
jgi:hypothetical protein